MLIDAEVDECTEGVRGREYKWDPMASLVIASGQEHLHRVLQEPGASPCGLQSRGALERPLSRVCQRGHEPGKV